MQSLLLVDANDGDRAHLSQYMKMHGFNVHEAEHGAQALKVLRSNAVSAVLINPDLPDQDGVALATHWRWNDGLPIIVLSNRDEEMERIVLLESFADDVVSKPLKSRELVARLRSILRRSKQPQRESALPASPPHRARLAHLTVDFDQLAVSTLDGKPIPITSSEFRLLELFIRRPKRVLSRDEIMDALKGNEWTSHDRSIDVMIAKLRKKIDAPDGTSLIRTIRGIGYMLTASAE